MFISRFVGIRGKNREVIHNAAASVRSAHVGPVVEPLEGRRHFSAIAFPGAVGVGANATGGRGGTVYQVTNLNDSGTGSFRDAVSQPNRIVVFDVGGYVTLSSAVSVASNLTIAGQTAPGQGIGIMGREVSFSGSSNDIVRYIRFRQGSLDPDSSKSGINLLNATDMIFDHVSIEFAQWNNIDAVGASDITIQNSIDSDPIGQQFSAHTETGPYTWYDDVFANSHNRNPLAKANTQFINNVVYNYQAGYTAGNTGAVFQHDIVNNYFISGPSTTNANDAFYQMNNQDVYMSGNYLDSNRDGSLGGSLMGQPSGTVALTAPWSSTTNLIPTATAGNAYSFVTATAGDSLSRDQVDSLVIADVTSLGSSGHLWTSQTQTGLSNSGYGTITGGTAPTDTDGDGIPDAWETAHGLNPNNAADASAIFGHTGYENIERYINSLANPQILANGTYTIRNLASNLQLDDPASSKVAGTQMIQYTANGGNNQNWTFNYVGNGYYTIQNAASGLFLDSTSTTIRTPLIQNTATGGTSQQWSLLGDGGSGFVLLNRSTNLVADDPNFNLNPSEGIQMFTQNDDTNQDWIFE